MRGDLVQVKDSARSYMVAGQEVGHQEVLEVDLAYWEGSLQAVEMACRLVNLVVEDRWD